MISQSNENFIEMNNDKCKDKKKIPIFYFG